MLMLIYSDYSRTLGDKPKIVILLDHVLDGLYGIDLLQSINKKQEIMNLDILWVIVSSTEDIDTIAK